MSHDFPYWSKPIPELLSQLDSSLDGLRKDQIVKRQLEFGKNAIKPKQEYNTLRLFFSQFRSPIIIILFVSAILSFFLGEITDGIIIIIILLASGILSFVQEHQASQAIQRLLALVSITTQIIRDGQAIEIPIDQVVPGDIVKLSAGDIIPADCRLISSKDLYVDEAAFTGESFPRAKQIEILPLSTELTKRDNVIFMRTHVNSGTCTALVIATGTLTEFGKLYDHIGKRPVVSDFELGIKHFGFLIFEITLLLIFIIFGINIYLNKPIIDAFLFSLAIAVGLTPQLLPAIISINLAKVMSKLADQKVIVKQAVTIENFGSMDLLCLDKTGTITTGVLDLQSYMDFRGHNDEQVLTYAYYNSFFQLGYSNPIDKAILNSSNVDTTGIEKLDEIPYDFVRKRLSILIKEHSKNILICKGAVKNILEACSYVTIDQEQKDITPYLNEILSQFQQISENGSRTIAVAYRSVQNTTITKADEHEMIFLGFLSLFDPLKIGIKESLHELQQLKINYKIISGDNELVAKSTAQRLGIPDPRIMTGSDLRELSEAALVAQVSEIDIFAEIEPNQKERVIRALRKAGHVVGYMGDGINDISALRAADIAITVDNAVDVAKETAQIVLMEKNIDVLIEGVKVGRKVFSNTLKYIFITIGSNFGNMLSIAFASLFIPFLPLLPKQILLLNLISDLPSVAIATDNVDPELLHDPQRWDIKFIQRFMLVFGSISSFFDFLLFAILLLLLKVRAIEFRTSWFLLSILTEIMVLLVLRTRKTFFRSRPSSSLLLLSGVIGLIGLIFPYLPFNHVFGFEPLPLYLMAITLALLVSYCTITELVKYRFYKQRIPSMV